MAAASTGAWAPLASPVYRALWIAQLVSNLGTWMQTVGAQWMLVSDPGAAVLVPLVQTATTLPVMLLALPSGVLADLTDRRRLLIATQSAMAAGVGMLAVLTGVGLATPAVLLILLFLIGCGQALTAPAWQAIQPELVPREQIPAAAALTSLSMNSARAIGPAVAGALVAVSGPTVVFALNAVSFIGIVAVLAWWQRPSEERLLPTERPLSALSAGRRYIRSSPVVRRILLRAVLFIAPASALWALLPVIADRQLHLSSAGYGVLLGALGFGAVCGATVLSRLQLAFGRNALLAVGAIGFAVAAAVLALVPVFAVAIVVLVLGGLSWLLTLSTLNAAMQLSLPAWVRARGLSVYQLVFMGGQAVGSLVWGVVAGATGSVTALVASAGLLAVCALTLLWWPLHPGTGDLDVEPSAHWGEPALVFQPEPPDGPVVVLRSYQVDPADEAAFIEAMQRVGRSRQRTGAAQWGLFRSGEYANTFVEAFMVRSWEEHLHQHVTRQTGQDLLAEQAVEKYVVGEPTLQHLIAVNPAGAAPARLRPRLRRRRSAPAVAPPTNGPHNRSENATDSG
ncbi:transmembrane transporter [Mycolicibacterium phlei]|jgi:MFS family permease|uniref:Major facilitator transporter n=1 Tax=Mycolicibacterium phlei DSM 43239 = CCUG 21000 TaxID=1226750 RepID=A0A5N5VDI5_MYCPH|nr:MFS transporter [Mycolicibacterium phlei]VEG11745.1 transmembrane transporter [Mycobacteroides chelonae]AMO63652.1 Enterobactin exporter EntS [Mycolicibacterium phlei]EID12809.1 transmembrane transporter [Mycolicibacterium phlei RIVM601174]KAB7760022.1 major facilitator transporter [Mycolicibacterium phlei DSM 43239 = CCUG 21000]KXW69071.1 major facilitator transporter [Mycolicibacterium phlei DSM 43239 = CCUG 21000]